MMASSTLCMVIIFLFPATVLSFCYTAEPKYLQGPRGMVPYCDYKGIKLAPTSNFEDLDRCRQVNCDDKGIMSICATGIEAGVVALPGGCLRLNDLCVEKVIQDPLVTAACPFLRS